MMMSRFTLLFLLLPVLLVGQKHDYVWLFGYDNRFIPEDSLWGNSIIDFNYSPPKVYYDGYKNMFFDGNAISVSDKEGSFLFSSNGNWLLNHENQPIEGDDFNFGDNPDLKKLINPGASYFVPLEEENQFGYLYSVHEFEPQFCGKNWWYAVVDMNKNNGLGEVTLQKNILSDTLELAKISGVKHGNGKDWWFLTKKYSSNHFFKILFDGKNFSIFEQEVGQPTFDGLGQALFSPDGTKYANVSSIGRDFGRYLDIYDFDRCSGELSNHIQVHRVRDEFSGGLAFSPNSRFLYVSDYERLLQYDTWEENVLVTEVKIAEYDGFVDTVFTGPTTFFPSRPRFLFMQLAPDGKIYIAPTTGGHYLHTIENPNEKGVACNVKQRTVRLSTPNTSIPTFPNYRLGALEGSPCDTLNLSNNSEIKEKHQIKISPNPANHQLNIEIADNFSKGMVFHLFDINGKKVKTVELTNSFQRVNLDGLAAGLFFYQILENGRLLKTDKVVVMR